jgi:glutamate synthase (NADPH/NADH) large chain/glutamate synthase (ferredoxin)
MPLNQSVLDATEHFSGLYEPAFEHDACGVGLVANISGQKTNATLRRALNSVCSLVHRGAMDADAKTGDRPEVSALGFNLFQDSDLGVGMIFLPNDPYTQARCRHITEKVLTERKLFVFGWRVVPTNSSVLGEKALRTCPDIEQVLVGRPDVSEMSDDDYERTLFLCRNEIEDQVEAQGIRNFYIPSFSSRWFTRACWPRLLWRSSTWICAIPTSRPRWLFFINATAPILSPLGRSPSHCAW